MKLRLLIACVFLAAGGLALSTPGHEGHAFDEDAEIATMLEARESSRLRRIGDERQCADSFTIETPAPFRKVVMTFDDGPDGLTPGLLDTLKKHGVKATFFSVGEMAAKGRATLARMKREGHIVASHSWSHPQFPKIPLAQQLKEIDDNEKELAAHVGKTKLFRFPYGSGTCPAWDHLTGKKYGIVGWHVDSCDWGFNKTGSVDERTARICGVTPGNRADYFRHVIDTVELKQGGIILFHDAFRTRTVPQVESIILELKARGYSFTNLDDPEFHSSIWWNRTGLRLDLR